MIMGATSTPMGVGKSFHRKWNSKMAKLGPTADPPYPQCMEEPKTVQPWLQRYPHLDVLRQRTFGSPSYPRTSALVPGDRRPCPEQGQRRYIATILLRCATWIWGGHRSKAVKRSPGRSSSQVVKGYPNLDQYRKFTTFLFFPISSRRILCLLQKCVRVG